MSLDRYVRDDEGFRKYVELMEEMPTAKRGSMMEAAKKENPFFVETAAKYILTFERITNLPDLELTEVLGAPGLKPEVIAVGIVSVTDAEVRTKLLKHIPRNLASPVAQEMKDKPEPKAYDIGAARLQIIKKARELEKKGKLDSVQIPRFGHNYFLKKTA
jgi:flagellar motor switch protein FliG